MATNKKMFASLTLSERLAHAVTEYDRKQRTKRHYNMFALGQYLQAVESASAAIDAGADAETVLRKHFEGRLLNAVLKAL